MRLLTTCGLFLFASAATLAGCGDDDPAGTGGMGGTGGTGGGGAPGTTTFEVTIENTSPTPGLVASGVFDTPVGEAMPGPLPPGSSYEIQVDAAPGYPARMGATAITFAAMFVPSNDLFFAPGPEGIALFDEDGMPRSGEVTQEVMVWDAGTEADEPLNGDMATSPNQKPHQDPAAEDVGPDDPVAMVRLAEVTYPGEIPAIENLVTVTLANEVVEGVTRFTLTIENVSGPGTLGAGGPFGGAVPLSPGVYAVYTHASGDPGPFFTPGEADFDMGIDDIAEDGFPMRLADNATMNTGVVVVSSPGAWAVHSPEVSFFEDGAPVGDTGLEAIAEDGDASGFLDTLGGLEGVMSSGMIAEMPFGPGGSVSFEIQAMPGDVLSLATMFVPSNDLLFANGPTGIDLFDASGDAVSGDVTSSISIWDAGTEINQPPGVGLDQVHLQSGPDTGAADPDDTARPVDDGFDYPTAGEVLRVTITPM